MDPKYYKNRLSELPDEIAAHAKWRWSRFLLHPRMRGYYAYWLRWCHRIFPNRFSDADPFKIIWVDPSNIQQYALNLPATWGRVIGGNWQTKCFEEQDSYNDLKERYIEHKPWSDIDHGIGDPKVWDKLFDIIKEEGYKSQKDLNNVDDVYRSWDTEVGVAIGANGEIIWVGRGSHRLRIAKIQGIENIPVQVRIRHLNWQSIRDEVRLSTVSELSSESRSYLNHPDLSDLLNHSQRLRTQSSNFHPRNP